MVPVEPAHRAGHQERSDLVAAVVEDRRVPVGVVALPRIGVLEQVRAVEFVESVRVVGEVRRNPVENHADAALVEAIDHRHQVARRAVAGTRGEEPGGLVAPRPVERVLHDREELDMGEPVGEHVIGDWIGEFVVAREALSVGDVATPRSEVQLVDRDRCVERDALGSARHPLVVVPFVVEVGDHRGDRWRLLGGCSHRVGLLDHRAVGRGHAVHVGVADFGAVDPAGPHT